MTANRFHRLIYMFAVLLALSASGLMFAITRDAGAHTAYAAAAPSAPVWGGPALAHMGDPGAWNCDTSRPWIVSDRWGEGSGNAGSVGGSLPEIPDDPATAENESRSYVAVVVANFSQRYYRMTLYSNLYGDLTVVYPFDAIQPEGDYRFPTGRFDPLGDPQPWMSGNLLRLTVGLWGGGSGNTDYSGRAYLWCRINR